MEAVVEKKVIVSILHRSGVVATVILPSVDSIILPQQLPVTHELQEENMHEDSSHVAKPWLSLN